MNGFWNTYLSLILIIVVTTAAQIIKPTGELREKAEPKHVLLPLPLGKISEITKEDLEPILALTTNHKIKAIINVGGDLEVARRLEESLPGIEVYSSGKLYSGTAEVVFLYE